MNNALVTKATRIVAKTRLSLKKHSPEILVVTGIVGVVTSTVMACKATTRASAIIEDTKEKLDQIHECMENEELVRQGKYTPEDAKKDLAITYIQAGVAFAKLYGPSVIIGALSITSILASNNILRKRNIALGAAYSALDKGFTQYRNNVIERFGEKVDKELKYNIKPQKVTEVEVDPETGEEKKVKKTIDVVDGDANLPSPYARFYDDGNAGWEKDPESNLFFLRSEQNFANDKLRARGYLTLNEVYERLGYPATKAGQVVGWVYDPDNPEHKGDNYVDFGIYNINRKKSRDFVNGYERVILLDFNVDGPILDQIETHQR